MIKNVKLSKEQIKTIMERYLSERGEIKSVSSEITNIYHLQNGELLLEIATNDEDSEGPLHSTPG